jgi:two-component system CheB/CheR fusion protein
LRPAGLAFWLKQSITFSCASCGFVQLLYLNLLIYDAHSEFLKVVLMPTKEVKDEPVKRQEKKLVAATKKTKKVASAPAKASDSESFPIVGIGASAGGLEAFTDFLKNLPNKTGMAFVFIQHLAAGQESLLRDILSRSTSMAVHRVKNDMHVKRNNVYVIPPDVSMTIIDRTLMLKPQESKLHRPVDQFLISLAKEAKNRAIGVVLSGTGTDGTEGLKAIYAEGGITFAQDEDSAKYPGMPHSAVVAGVVHFSFPPQKIAEELAKIGKHPYLNHTGFKVVKPEIEEQDDFRTILAILRLAYGVDFSSYKESTVNRRLSRRMVINQVDKMDKYVKLLRTNKAEAEALFTDLLIGVTNFFREPEAFDLLNKEVFPAILEDKTSKYTIRVWVPGCSSGEEVYSLAICLREYLERSGTTVNVQIFGTDVSEKNIEKARAGIYPETIVDNVSEERLRHFFAKTNHQYQINKSIRDMCIFAKQDLTHDPPFSNLDIVSCRNVLIYFKPQIQKKIIPLFHYALKPGGFLLLGKSESVGGFNELFSPLNKGIVYTKRPVPSKANFGMAMVEPYAQRDHVKKSFVEKSPLLTLEGEMDRILMNRYAPPGVVVNGDMDIIIFQGNTAPFISPSSGEASLNLLKMLREELKLELQTAIYLAKKQKTPIRREGIFLKNNDETKKVNIELIPMQTPKSKETYFLVLFEEAVSTTQKADKNKQVKAQPSETNIKNGQITDLRRELASTKETLQTIIEEREATNEELRAALEEVQSSNEELQSTNEELETAKEELQSTNEELNTLNEELANRNRELTRMHDDLNNLFANIDVAIIVLDNDLKIRLFNPIAEKIFNLIPTDTGRPISDIRLRMIVTNLEVKLTKVLENFVPIQQEVHDEKNNWYEMRIRPYLTAEKKIDGVVLTFVDIDAVIRSRKVVEKSRDFAENVLETMHEPLIVLDDALRVVMANPSFYKIFKTKPSATLKKHIYEVGTNQWDIPEFRQALEKILNTGGSAEGVIIGSDFPEIGKRILSLNIRQLPSLNGKEILVTAEDITESKQLEEKHELHRIDLEKKLESAENLAVIGQTAGMVGHDIRNPLQAIVSATYLAKDDLASLPQNEIKESLIESMKEIEDQAAYIGKIVADLQDFSRPLKPFSQETDLRKLIDNLLLTIETEQNIEIISEITHNLDKLKVDPDYLKRILTNLLMNAEQAMHNGGRITITARKEKGKCVITVEDTGEGISEDVKPKLFQPLFTTKSKGQGFGLAVSKRLANAMGGDLTFESEKGNGAKFTLKLPNC